MTEPEESKAPPKLFEHCCRVFEEMRKHAVWTPLTDGGVAREAFVWEGHTTKLFRDLALPTPYYTKVLDRLKKMGCVMQLGRGGGTAVSRWELLDDPSFEDFDEAETNQRKLPSRLGQVEQNVVLINNRVVDLEEQVKTLVEVFQDHLGDQRESA